MLQNGTHGHLCCPVPRGLGFSFSMWRRAHLLTSFGPPSELSVDFELRVRPRSLRTQMQREDRSLAESQGVVCPFQG